MTTKKIQLLIGKMQVLKFHSPVCENLKYLLDFNSWKMDVVSLSKAGMLYEFEVKISRSDFKVDAKKRKHQFYKSDEFSIVEKWTPNYFSYACPKDLITVDEIPDYAGLYYCKDEEVKEIRKPKRLHKLMHDRIKILEKVCRVNQERQFLGSCLLTYNNRLIREKNRQVLNENNNTNLTPSQNEKEN
jgi:hypothetical protein